MGDKVDFWVYFGDVERRHMCLHIQLPTSEIRTRTVEELKIKAIGIFYGGYRHLLSQTQEDFEIQKCFLARSAAALASSSSSSVCTYVPIDDLNVANFDDEDIAFLLTEGEDHLLSISEEIELLQLQTEKYCLVYIPEVANKIKCESDRRNWLLEEELPLLQQLQHNNDRSSLSSCTSDLLLTSLTFSIRRAYQVPISTMSLSIVLIKEKEESKGVAVSKYLTYLISIKNNGLNWEVEHRFSDFKKLRTVLQSQDPEEIGM